MIERGRIEQVNGSMVTVRQERGINCFGCMNQECRETRGLVTAWNATGRLLRTGQMVETEIPVLSLFREAATALVPPLLVFALCFIISGKLFPALGEGARAALGCLGLFACAGALYLRRRPYPPKDGPEVLRALED